MGNTARLLIDGKSKLEGDKNHLEMNVEIMGDKKMMIEMLMQVFKKNEDFFNMCHIAVHTYMAMSEEDNDDEEVNDTQEQPSDAGKPEQVVQEQDKKPETFTVTIPVIKNTDDLLSFFKDVGKKLEKKMIEVAETLPKENK